MRVIKHPGVIVITILVLISYPTHGHCMTEGSEKIFRSYICKYACSKKVKNIKNLSSRKLPWFVLSTTFFWLFRERPGWGQRLWYVLQWQRARPHQLLLVLMRGHRGSAGSEVSGAGAVVRTDHVCKRKRKNLDKASTFECSKSLVSGEVPAHGAKSCRHGPCCVYFEYCDFW